ncbi:MAG: tetratricopeptide repeat protein [Anaerolineae bacterium]
MLEKALYTLKDAIITPMVRDIETGILSGGVYDQHGNLFLPAERSHLMSKVRIINQSTIDPNLKCDEIIDDRAIYLGHFTHHYGHFLLETLARFWATDQEKVDNYLFHSLFDFAQSPDNFSPAKVCFGCFQIDENKIDIVQRTIRVKNLIVPTMLVAVNDQVNLQQAEIYQKIVAYCQKQNLKKISNYPKKIYLSRKKLTSSGNQQRFATNEVAVEALFQQFGYTIIYPEELDFADQVLLFQAADVVAGIGGSALHNSVFMQPGATLITLGTPREPNAPNLNQLICDNLAQVSPVFIPFKGAILNQDIGNFAYYIPHLRRHLQQLNSLKTTSTKISIPRPENKKLDIIVAIVGLHPDGANCLAQALDRAGLFSGDISRTVNLREEDMWENERLSLLNEAVLHANDASWDNPPKTALKFDKKLIYARERNISNLARQSSIVMFKDAQTLLNLPFWEDGVERLQLVGIFCHPMDVAMSFYEQNKIPLRKGFELGSHYNKLLLEAYRKSPFPLICVDQPATDFLKQLKKSIKQVSDILPEWVNLSIEKGVTFFSNESLNQINLKAILTEGLHELADEKAIAFAEVIYDELLTITKQPRPDPALIIAVPLENSTEALQQAIKNSAENAYLHIMLGDTYLTLKNIDSAVKSYQKALEINPQQLTLQIKLGDIFTENGEISRAIHIFEELVNSDELTINATVNMIIKLIILYREQENFEKVIDLCKRAFSMNPIYQVHHLTTLMANGKRQLGELDKALELYQKAVVIDPHKGYVYQAMGDIYKQQADFQAAAENYQKAIDHHSKNIWVYIKLGQTLNQLGRYEESRFIMQKGAEIDPNQAHIYRVWGDAYRLEGSDLNAVDQYQRSIALNRTLLGPLINLGFAFIRLGRYTEALEVILQARDLQPENPNIKRALKKLTADS